MKVIFKDRLRLNKRSNKMDTKITYYVASSVTSLDKPIETICERGFYSKPNGWFENKEEATLHYMQARGIAFEKIKVIRSELTSLQEKLKFYIDYNMSGDTHGIYDDYQYICLQIDGYEFTSKIS